MDQVRVAACAPARWPFRIWVGGFGLAAECPGTGGAMVRLGPAPPTVGTRHTLCPMLKVEILLAHTKTPPSCACSIGLYICIQEISKRSGHCDLLVKCSDGQVQVHSAVMAAQSKVSNAGGILF